MVVFFLFSAVAAIGTLAIGLYILLLDTRQELNRLFSLMCFVLFGFISCSTLSYSVGPKESLLFWYHLSSFFFGSFFAVNLCFILCITRNKVKPCQYLLIFLPAPILVCLTYFDFSLFSDFIYSVDHWKFLPATEHFGWYFYIIYYSSYLVISMATMNLFSKRTNLNKEKRQMRLISLFLLISLIASTAADFILPQMESYTAPPIGPSLIGFYVFGIFYAIFRYGLMDIRPSYVADEIIANVSDMVILINQKYEIIAINGKAGASIGRERNGLIGDSFFALLQEPGSVKECFDRLLSAAIGHTTARIRYKKGNGEISTDSYVSKITDRFLDPAGFLVISHENSGRDHMQATYKITTREFEIIDHCVSGLSNAEISARLRISVRTVETHLANIYSKLGVNNKIELMGLAFRFGLVDKR